MIECPKCNLQVEDYSNYCDQCGTEIYYKECIDCEYGNRPIAKFCSKCGSNNLQNRIKEEPEPWSDGTIEKLF